MLTTILLIDDASRTLSFPSLRSACRQLRRCSTEAEAELLLEGAESVVLHTDAARLTDWTGFVGGKRRLPMLWLCCEERAPREPDWGNSLDGLLFPTMTPAETALALRWALRCHLQRKRWAEEREQLLLRLEERKWIDRAKAVLCEVKGISEAEAYDCLRKQAMNERKRIGDVAANIVKVYQLIHG